ncbi:RusA family crossover junction endodeoxyribonuclease [Sansalvadorimonas verongulae]|uniref:RusA family crossover junction endodeoxyribonuclease n=1 Tax=Sansalvadorimonas verongulae TaxID=2172824 RepID=UPI0012BB50DF|nr:RusA family crossover junction endodeoxyribonuclease [Sansalvadorimonas verongulae]MTI13802.1 RusA family crossover junction endodeoxyribonuclease [Sansalvadorimonas verongulae]
MRLVLPFPPTVNHVWKHTARIVSSRKAVPCVYMTEQGKRYREDVKKHCRSLGLGKEPMTGSLRVRVRLHFPTNRRADLDNRMKALFDALTHAGIWEDDSQIDFFQVERGEKIRDGKVLVEVLPLVPGRDKQ